MAGKIKGIRSQVPKTPRGAKSSSRQGASSADEPSMQQVLAQMNRLIDLLNKE